MKLFRTCAKDCVTLREGGGKSLHPRVKSGKMLQWWRLPLGFSESLLRYPSNMQSGRLVNNIIMAEISGHINIIGQRAQEWWWLLLMPGCQWQLNNIIFICTEHFPNELLPVLLLNAAPFRLWRRLQQQQQNRTTGFAIVWRWWNKQRDVSSAGETSEGAGGRCYWGNGGGNGVQQTTVYDSLKPAKFSLTMHCSLSLWPLDTREKLLAYKQWLSLRKEIN